MDLISKVKELAVKINKLEELTDDLNENLESKIKRIEYLKSQIDYNIKKIFGIRLISSFFAQLLKINNNKNENSITFFILKNNLFISY